MNGIEIISTAAKLAEDKYTMDLDSPEIKKIINIVEEFLKNKKLICYGGTAINNILPKESQFYTGKEFPDYDFYSTRAMDDAKELADIYNKNGFLNVLAKSGMHFGTYKVFVNYLPVADITQFDSTLYKKLAETAFNRKGIYYCPPDFLRMNMYLELSRPKGDVSRWEKVYSRLSLLNKHYPIKTNDCSINNISNLKYFDRIVECFQSNKCIFFGGKALDIYSKYNDNLKKTRSIIDVFHEDPMKCIKDLKNSIPEISFTKDNGIHEIFPPNYILKINSDIVAIIYEPIACYSYITVNNNNKNYRIASIFTLLSMYFLFTYMDKCKMYNTNRIMCIASIIYDINEKNFGKGIFKEIPVDCYGEMHTLQKILEEKTEQFKKLKNKRNTKEYELWFLKYDPLEEKKTKLKKSKSKSKYKSRRRSKTFRKTKKKYNKRGGGSKCVVYYIHSESCGHCKHFNPTWDELTKEYDGDHILKKVDFDNKPDNIETNVVPYIVAERGNKLIPFKKTRDKDNLLEFINNL